uniref:Uncharacterized protein n=1 Tax=Lotus japonicus TaxID=34305 RepID=I3SM73_LOTJA|nr:unknown [Lotus japonicus]
MALTSVPEPPELLPLFMVETPFPMLLIFIILSLFLFHKTLQQKAVVA